MSKFMHKVKDAVTDHNMDTTGARGSQAPHNTYGTSNPPKEYDSNENNSSGMNTSSGMGSNNPYGSDTRSGNEPGTYRDSRMGNRGGRSDPDTYGSAATGRDNLTSATQPSSSDRNTGPHDSKVANKMDPRVDSDLDNRAQSAGGSNPQHSSNVPSNTASQEQPRTSGVDNHLASDDDYNKSTEETKSQSQPANYDPRDQQTSEESHHTATHEHKSHSSTTHTMPCQTNLQDEQGTDNRTAGQGFGGNAAGGSSTSGATELTGAQTADPLNKMGPQATRSNQQSNVADQRGGY
ncbi:unnamed protein product [Penicillium glandicola]